MKKRQDTELVIKSLGEFAVVELEDALLENVRAGEHVNCGCAFGCECNMSAGCGTKEEPGGA